MSMRKGASVCQLLALISDPRGARMMRWLAEMVVIAHSCASLDAACRDCVCKKREASSLRGAERRSNPVEVDSLDCFASLGMTYSYSCRILTMKRDYAYPEYADPKVRPRYTGIATFMRTPYVEDLATIDIALAGIPFDGGVTNRPG